MTKQEKLRQQQANYRMITTKKAELHDLATTNGHKLGLWKGVTLQRYHPPAYYESICSLCHSKISLSRTQFIVQGKEEIEKTCTWSTIKKQWNTRVLIASIVLAFVIWVTILESGTTRSCADGWMSRSIGRQGACSHHGGVVVNRSLGTIVAAFGLAGGIILLARFPGRTIVNIVIDLKRKRRRKAIS